MGIFDFLRKKPKEKKPIGSNPLISRLLPQSQFGREMISEDNAQAQLQSYRSWVFVASNLNAQSVAQVPLRLYVAKPSKNIKMRFPTKEISQEQKEYLYKYCKIWKYTSVRRSVDIEEVVEHPIFDLFRNVNNFNNSFDLWEITQLHQELTGTAYWYLVGGKRYNAPFEIWTIPPDRCFPIPDPKLFIKGYRYRYGSTVQDFDESEVIQFKFVNPRNPYIGISPLVAAMSAYNINENMSRYESAIFRNMGRLSGAFTTEESLSDQDWDRIKQELLDAYGGVDNAGKWALLDNGLEYKDFGFSPTELSFIEGRKLMKEELLNAYGQSIALYSENPNRANADAAERSFMRRTIRPRCIRLAEKLNEKLCPRYDDNLFLAFDDPSPEDALISARIREINIRTGVTSINEERTLMHKPPFKNGDEPLVQSQYIPLSLAASGAALKTNREIQGTPREGRPPEKDIQELSRIIAKIIKEKHNEE